MDELVRTKAALALAEGKLARLREQYDNDLSVVRRLYETDSAELRLIRKGIRHFKWFMRRVRGLA